MKTASRLLLVLISPLALLGFGAADFSPADIVAESLELTPLQHGNSDQVNKWVGEVCIQDVSLKMVGKQKGILSVKVGGDKCVWTNTTLVQKGPDGIGLEFFYGSQTLVFPMLYVEELSGTKEQTILQFRGVVPGVVMDNIHPEGA